MSKLSSPISLDIYSSHAQASIYGKKCSVLHIAKGATAPIFLTAPNVNDKYTKHSGIGHYLQGSMTFAKDDDGKRADAYTVKYIINESAKKDKTKNQGSKKSDNGFAEAMAEQKITWIGKMDPNSDESIKLFDLMKKDESANQAQLRLSRISGLFDSIQFSIV